MVTLLSYLSRHIAGLLFAFLISLSLWAVLQVPEVCQDSAMSCVFETHLTCLAKRVLVCLDATCHKPFAPAVVEINACSDRKSVV